MLPTSDALEHALHALTLGVSDDPFGVLGPHVRDAGETSTLVIRTLQPAAERVEIVRVNPDGSSTLTEMTRLRQQVIFAAEFPGEERIFDYRLRITEHEGFVREIVDPYRYGQVMGELDLHLLGEGRHYRAFERLGSHALKVGSATGTYFAVWAPNAERVSLVGDFNQWHGLAHPMRRLVPNGISSMWVKPMSFT